MLNPLTVMLIDDNETDNFIARSIIEKTGLVNKFSEFTSARKAFQFLESMADDETQLPELIFLDINMPIVSGILFLYDLDKLAPKLSRDPKVVLLSSFEKTKDTDKIIDSPRVIRYLTKPLGTGVFEEIVKSLELEKAKVA